MAFDSFAFLALHSSVVVAFHLLPHRARWMLLLGASYYFYMYWRPAYALILVATTVVDYSSALLMERWSGGERHVRRRLCLALSLACNLGLLFFFKYYAFATQSLGAILGWAGAGWCPPMLELLLPMGISFYTFQSMAYTIDAYRRDCRAERHFGLFALYVANYPQLVAGPIERPGHLLPQFHRPHGFDEQAAREGLRRILWGLFKKSVIADRLAAIAAPVFADPQAHAGAPLWIGTYAFALQIYADFSAYSDIAIGSARMLGFELVENFKRPYFAASIGEFWQRWHVSLSTRFRDYLYLPLYLRLTGGSRRVDRPRWACAVLLVFLSSGLWHGAAWTFVVWGGLHGLWLVMGEQTRSLRQRALRAFALPERARRLLACAACFHLVCAGWVFFRAGSLWQALDVFRHLLDGSNAAALARILPTGAEASALCLALGLWLVVDLADEAGPPVWKRCGAWPAPARWLAYASVTLMLFNFAVVDEVPFLYFQF